MTAVPVYTRRCGLGLMPREFSGEQPFALMLQCSVGNHSYQCTVNELTAMGLGYKSTTSVRLYGYQNHY